MNKPLTQEEIKELSDNLTWNLRTQDDVDNVIQIVDDLCVQCIEMIKEFMTEQIDTNNMVKIISAKLVMTNNTLNLVVKYDDDETHEITITETDEVLLKAWFSNPHYINIDTLMPTFATSRGYVLKNGVVWKD